MKRGLKDEEEGMNIYNTEVYIIQNDGFEKDGIKGRERWMQIEDRTEGKGRYETIIYNAEVYIIQNDGFGQKMDVKEEKDGCK
jgi:hypothetical protein